MSRAGKEMQIENFGLRKTALIASLAFATLFAGMMYVEDGSVPTENISSNESFSELDHYFGPPPGPQERHLDRKGFEYVRYGLNEQGFRDDENYTVEKPEDVYRVAFFGDSVLTGGFVNHSYVWTEILERRLNNDLECRHDFSVMNMGINAHDAPYTAEYYSREGKEYQTDLDVFVFQNNDVYEVGEVFRETIKSHKERYKDKEGELPDHPSKEYSQLIEEASEEAREKVDRIEKEELFERQIHRPVRKIARETDDRNSTVILTLTVDKDVKEEYREAAIQNDLRFVSMNDLGDNYGYDGLWAQYSFPSQKEPHPDEEGNQLISDYVYLYLVTNNLVRCDYYDAFE